MRFREVKTFRAAGKNEPISRPIRLPKKVEDPLSALLAKLLDSSFVIPGTGIRFGLDALVGLVPGVGDSAGALVSSVIIAQSARLGVPRIVLARMAGNVLLNTVVGALPLFGDVFSVFFRSNIRNYELLQLHAGQRHGSTALDWMFVVAILAGMLALVGAIIFGAFFVARKLLGAG